MKKDTYASADNQAEDKSSAGRLYEYMDDYNSDLEVHDNYIVDFDAYEAMMISKTYDSVSKQTKNGITDSDAATMIIERGARVVGQLPEGEVMAYGKKDKGKAALMNILLQKWIYPNANAQRPFLEKIRLWEVYSDVYGVMPMYYDWDVNSITGYVGPNCWLWSPRNFIPQQGRFSIADMEHAHAISYMSHSEIKKLIDNYSPDSGWNLTNLQTLLDRAKNSSKQPDTLRDSYVNRQRNNRSVKGRIMLVTRYESGYRELNEDGSVKEYGHWCTFSPEFSGLELRDIENPHKNGKIPFVMKPCIPLLDSFYGLSDMARAKPIQFAKDGLTNFYFQGIKMNIYPPTVVNAQGILKHTVSNEPGSIWEEIIPNSARRLETSTAGLATYQAAMGQMSGALQNVFGTTTTQSNADSAMSPQFGKTPEAIKYQTGRESSRDNQNRAYLQQALEELVDSMMALIPVMGTASIPVDMFSEDIKEIKDSGWQDIFEMVTPNQSGTSGRLTINPASFKNLEFRFYMDPDSTIKNDKADQVASLKDLMSTLGQNANVLQEVQQSTGKMPNWPQILQSYVSLTDVPGIDKVFIDMPVKQDPNDHPLMKLITNLGIKFESLPEDSKHEILVMMGVPSKMPSPVATDNAIKAYQATAPEMSANAQTTPQSPIAPQSVNGMLFHDPSIHAVATDLHGMRQPTPVGAPNAANAGK